MQAIGPLVPSFTKWQEEMKLNAVKLLATAAAANMIFQAYHLKKSQTALNAGYFAGLYITDDAIRNGMIADNVEETRRLSRDVQGNLEESTRVLAGLSLERESLSSEVGDLKLEVKNLNEVREGIEEATERLKRIGGHVEESVKNLAQRAQALKLEIETLEKIKEERNV